MTKIIKIILLEDTRSDAEIIQRELKKLPFSTEVKWTQTRDQYKSALTDFSADLIISDHSLRGFTSVDAFSWLRDCGLDIPFILVTATISEEFAVTMMREGVADYLLKDRLQRLPLAVTNALEKWQAQSEKQASLEMLVNNERRFRALIERSHDMKILTDQDFRPVFASSSLTRITGRTLEEGREGNLDYVYPDDRVAYHETLTTAKATPGQYFPLLYRLLHKEGHYIWVEGTVINMLGDEAIQGILFNLRDVTAQKEAEESRKKSEAHLTAIIENSTVSIYAIDRQFRYISFNSHLKNTLKVAYGMDAKVGDPVFDFLALLDPLELEEWKKVYTEAFSGNRVNFEKEFKVGDYYACVNFSINPIVEGHYVTGLSCFAWDVTSQKQAAMEVARSEARFRALIEHNYDAIVMRDETKKVLYSSPSFNRMLGYSNEEVFDASFEKLLHPDDLGKLRQAYNELITRPGLPYATTMRVKTKNGNYIWVEGTITNLLGDKNVKGIVSNFRDISERKENELQREKITLELMERNNNLEQYAYIVSHNLRAPVANILGIANLVEMPDTEMKDKQEALAHLFSSARRLDEVIRDLNMILQVQQNIHEQKEDVNLDEVVKDIQIAILDLLRKSQVEITTNFKVKAVSTVKSYLYSIFYNLVTNSIKYKREGTRPVIRITSEQADNHVRIKFVDNGLGIDLEAHGSKIFGLYNRFHVDHAEGKGIGLFMTKTEVEALGGKISVKSQVNIGTEFLIEL